MSFLVKGLLNKQVAAELGMTVPTVKFHRAHVLEKMKAESIAELVRMSERLEAHSDEESAAWTSGEDNRTNGELCRSGVVATLRFVTPPCWPASGHDEVLRADGDLVLSRSATDDGRSSVLKVTTAAERPVPGSLARLEHEHALRNELDPAWAARPLTLLSDHGQTTLLLEDPGGEPLARLLGHPMEP